MLGAPGAGKGTQATELSARLGLPHVASGDLFRQALRDGTQLGLEARQYMDRGALVPDDLTIRTIGERLTQADAARGVILDLRGNRGGLITEEIEIVSQFLPTGAIIFQSQDVDGNIQKHLVEDRQGAWREGPLVVLIY